MRRKRFLVEDGAGRDPRFWRRFWRLAQDLAASYPSRTEEKRREFEFYDSRRNGYKRAGSLDLVTHNVRDVSRAAQFGVRVIRPAEFLEILRQTK